VRTLRAGHVDGPCYDLIKRTAAAVVRAGRYRSPAGNRRWTADDIDDLVSDFVCDQGRLVDLAVGAADDDHLRARIQKAMRHLLIDRLRRTPRGALRRRTERRLLHRPDVTAVRPRHWALVQYATVAHWAGDDGLLHRAARAVPVAPPPKWPVDSERQQPATDGESIDAICTTTLTTAAAPVDKQTVLDVVEMRVLGEDEPGVELGTGEDDCEPAALAPDVVAQVIAAAILDELEPEERDLLPALGQQSRDLAEEGLLELKHSAINVRQQKLAAKMRDLLAGIDERDAVVAALWRLHGETSIEARAGRKAAAAP
jgi:hypothetical protein